MGYHLERPLASFKISQNLHKCVPVAISKLRSTFFTGYKGR